jgi:outer membrane protein assembly factor BamB
MRPSLRRSAFLASKLAGVVGLALLIAGEATAGPAEEARAMLNTAGVQGGLIVHLGCGDGKLTAALRANDGCLVHGLDAEASNVEAARQHIASLGLYGKVSVDQLRGDRLPYIDNLVNLIVVNQRGGITDAELLRVLAPRGVALVAQPGVQNAKLVKPWPQEIDQWTHFLHGPDNNAVAQDQRVASPFHVQWVGDPKWARNHNHLSSTSAVVSAGGRLFAIVDEGSIASLDLPPQWRLVARDAFNGVVLWKMPIDPWEGVLRPFRSGPADLARRLVAMGDRVYVTPGYTKPVVALDAATGAVVRQYAATDGADEIICDGKTLYVVAGVIPADAYAAAQQRGAASPAPRQKRLLALDAASGALKWRKADEETSDLLPTTLCAAGGRVFFHSPKHLVCLDAASGQERWKSRRAVRTDRPGWSTPTVVVCDDVILAADGAAPPAGARNKEPESIRWTASSATMKGNIATGELIAYSTRDGAELWRCPSAQGYNVPADVFVAAGLVWASYSPGRNEPDFAEGRDLHTGKVVRRLQTGPAFTDTHHHRCYRDKATERFILLGRTGVEFIDLAGAEPVRNCWVRGACQYGVLPANGLLYAPPHACACYIQSKLSGFWALAPRREATAGDAAAAEAAPLEKGPAYGNVQGSNVQGSMTGGSDASLPSPHSPLPTSHSPLPTPDSPLPTPHSPLSSDDWPTYRHDAARTGRAATTVPAALHALWQAKLGGKLTSPVIGEGKLLVAAVDAHAVHALDPDSGRRLWQFVAGGRIDSPPTIAQGRAVLGCADGFVYCLRLDDGKLAWRFRAAPLDRRTVAFGQVESVWPVTGSVLERSGVVYCTAGRSSFLDGGMVLDRLDLQTGEPIGTTRFDSRDPKTGGEPEAIIEDVELPGALPDVLLCDGKNIFLRDKVLDLAGKEQAGFLPHLYSSAGLLDDSWWHRTYWLWGERTWGRASGWSVMPGIRPSGRLLASDEKTVFGYGRKNVSSNNLEKHHLFHAAKEVEPGGKAIRNNNLALTKYQKPAKVTFYWSREVPLVARALVLTQNVLLAAGPVIGPNAKNQGDPTFDAQSPAILLGVRPSDGTTLVETKLDAQPVFDGMAVARGKIYMATVDGAVVCIGGK